VKFVGAGQGPKALVAEWISGEIGRVLGLPIPELVFITLDETLSRSEPDPEIQDLLQNSIGLNLGMAYLPQAFAFNLLLKPPPDSSLASKIVWFDAFITNVDRTASNVNLLIWQEQLWLIDHGASLYFHHNWGDHIERSQTPFALIKDHTLLSFADALKEANQTLSRQLNETIFRQIVMDLPDVWLENETDFPNLDAHRQAYIDYLTHRLTAAPIFVEEAQRARRRLV
ncbi:MAG: HipA family kinase, partial [Chloroflexota bacterium]